MVDLENVNLILKSHAHARTRVRVHTHTHTHTLTFSILTLIGPQATTGGSGGKGPTGTMHRPNPCGLN